MAKKQGLNGCSESFGKIAGILLEELRREIGSKDWTFAFVEVRGPKKSATRVSKLRVGFPDGSVSALLDTPLENAPMEVEELFDEIWKAKDKAFPKPWYGVKVTVFRDKPYDVQFNYDPECVMEETFLAD